MNRFVLGLFLIFSYSTIWTQTANDVVMPYEGVFRPGSNLGEYVGFQDEQLADLAAGNQMTGVKGVGVKSLRPALYEDFVENFGYDARLSTFQHYASLGLKDNTLIVGFPSAEHQDPTQHCAGISSTLFRNMYDDIWDDGENGTPVNEDNYYANYIYQLVSQYKDHVKFWEIWNEPGFDYTKNTGWLPPGADGNWWDNNPDPCDYKLRAPIYHYIRLLRISYEVIKTVDPSAFVAVSGVGFPSFLDAILRNTDNPNGGFVSEDYPLGGGAYFDVMGFHFYPHFDGSVQEWNNDKNDWDYFRHSDAAADGLAVQKNSYKEVLETYGYDGTTFPQKHWIVTEVNLPRKAFGEYIGSDEAQRNFMIKSLVQAMKNDILQFHIYKLGEDTDYDRATFEFDLMGLYKKLDRKDLYFNEPNTSAIAHKSTSEILFKKQYDPVQTAALNLPDTIEGGAFKDEDGNYTYVLWAKTAIDKSELASAEYSFPANIEIENLIKRNWDYAITHSRTDIDNNNIALSASPIFLTEMKFSANAMNGCNPFTISFDDHTPNNAATWSWIFEGADPQTSALAKPTVIYNNEGTYEVFLEIKDADGNIISKQKDNIIVNTDPQVVFSAMPAGPIVQFNNESSLNTDSFLWEFGDGTTSTEANPNHLYLESGHYVIKLTGTNICDSKTYELNLDVIAPTTSKLTTTANESILAYQSPFRPGVNFQFYPPWTDEELANIAAGNIELEMEGLGVKSVRSLLPEFFLKGWGYNIREKTYNHYVNLDLNDNTAVLGLPSKESQDLNTYCPGEQSTIFKNLYIDIWDDGENGTPVNDENPYALYVYNTAQQYKPYVKFWQILNAPGTDISTERGWLPKGEAGNWWDNDPDPCDLTMKAPIYHYIRMLRISYEVIKFVDPQAYVTVSGLGFPSFLDALLRNTDNPIDGSVTTGYELTGGAYFDVLGFNVYPHVDGSTAYYDVNIGDFVFERHSDAAAKSIEKTKAKYQAVLDEYAYDGETFPKKEWIISECNIPRKSFNNYIGSEEAQRNFMIKIFIKAIQNDIRQLNVQALSEIETLDDAVSESQLMGLYKKLTAVSPYNQEATDEGIAFATSSKLLYASTYDKNKTEDLDLPEGILGAAFRNANGNYIYVLWAETGTDFSETASASYSFPNSFDLDNLIKRTWNFSSTNDEDTIPSIDIALTGTPIFLLENSELLTPPLALFQTDAQKDCAPFTVQFTEQSQNATTWEWQFPGGTPNNSTNRTPTVVYENPGVYTASLKVTNAAGTHSYTRLEYITADSIPSAQFSFEVDESWVQFNNASTNAATYIWDLGDGTEQLAFDPRHYYFENGEYIVKLIAENECGNDTITHLVHIANLPTADFQAIIPETCGPFEVQFQDRSSSSPSSWQWSFPAADETSSTEQNPLINYQTAGEYEVTLIVQNENGADTVIQTIRLNEGTMNIINQTLCEGEELVVNEIIYNQNNPSGRQTLEGASYLGCDSIISVDLSFESFLIAIKDTIQKNQSYTVGTSIYTVTGIYSDTLTSQLGCDSIVNLNLTVLTTSIENPLLKQLQFKAYPNPFDQNITISFDLQSNGNVVLEMIDLVGRPIKRILSNKALTSGHHQFEIKANDLPAGLYYCRMIYEGQALAVAVVKL